MFEKISIFITLFLSIMFSGIYYYQSGSVAPDECIELHNNYVKAIEVIESEDSKYAISELLTEDGINYIYHIEQLIGLVLHKQFKRTGLTELKYMCLKAQESFNLSSFLSDIEDYIEENPPKSFSSNISY